MSGSFSISLFCFANLRVAILEGALNWTNHPSKFIIEAVASYTRDREDLPPSSSSESDSGGNNDPPSGTPAPGQTPGEGSDQQHLALERIGEHSEEAVEAAFRSVVCNLHARGMKMPPEPIRRQVAIQLDMAEDFFEGAPNWTRHSRKVIEEMSTQLDVERADAQLGAANKATKKAEDDAANEFEDNTAKKAKEDAAEKAQENRKAEPDGRNDDGGRANNESGTPQVQEKPEWRLVAESKPVPGWTKRGQWFQSNLCRLHAANWINRDSGPG